MGKSGELRNLDDLQRRAAEFGKIFYRKLWSLIITCPQLQPADKYCLSMQQSIVLSVCRLVTKSSQKLCMINSLYHCLDARSCVCCMSSFIAYLVRQRDLCKIRPFTEPGFPLLEHFTYINIFYKYAIFLKDVFGVVSYTRTL